MASRSCSGAGAVFVVLATVLSGCRDRSDQRLEQLFYRVESSPGDSTRQAHAIVASEESLRRVRSVFGMPGAVASVPYWSSIQRTVGASSGTRLFAATNLVYPVFVLDERGNQLGTVGSPPPSWRQARPARFGEFPPERREEWGQYLNSFTVISALAVLADSILLVTHGTLRPYSGSFEYRVESTRLDVYVNGRRVIADAPSPGELVGYWGNSVYFAERGVPARTSVLEYKLRPGVGLSRGRMR